MLRYMKIRDFALIRELELDLQPGLNLLTGETGSGKSILVDALSLLLGARSSADMVRAGSDTAVLEGIFGFDPGGIVARTLAEAGVGTEEDSLVIRREVSSGGRTRVFLNNTLSTLSLLRAVGSQLADIHGQHDHHALLDLSTHLGWLDKFGGNEHLVAEVEAHFKNLMEIGRRLDSLAMDEQERLRRSDILGFQLEEIERARLQPNEIEELDGERKVLVNRERIFSLAAEAYQLLYDGEPSLLSHAKRLETILQGLEVFDPTWAAQRESLKECMYRLEDLSFTARDYTSGIDFSPDRLEQVELRLAELDKIRKKYGSTVPEIISYAQKCRAELDALNAHENTSRALAENFEGEERRYLLMAEKLSEKRSRDSEGLARELKKELHALSMEKAELSVCFHPRPTRGNGRLPSWYGPRGIDNVEFMLAPNKGEGERPLARIASGGELSRVMLSIKVLCGSGDSDRTLVFDEVDAGIGGRAAEAVGKRLRRVSEHSQVLCVTHLPQIACFAHHHYHVWKAPAGARIETSIKRLDEGERIEEMARMLGGERITETTRIHAREMLEHVQNEQIAGRANRTRIRNGQKILH